MKKIKVIRRIELTIVIAILVSLFTQSMFTQTIYGMNDNFFQPRTDDLTGFDINLNSMFLSEFSDTSLGGPRAVFGGENGTELFLGGKYIELGISNWGDFGTLGTKPPNFRGTLGTLGTLGTSGGSNQIGMSADHDGYNNGKDLPVDYYLPGDPEERFAVGYQIGGYNYSRSNSAQTGTKEMNTRVENLSDTAIGLLKAKTLSVWTDKMEVTQIISFNTDDKFYRNEVTLKNISSQKWDGARYMRSFDPDNTQFRGGAFETANTVTHTVAVGDGKAVVKAETYDDNDPLYKAFGSRSPIFFYSNDSRAVASVFGFANTNPYDNLAYETPQTKGNTVKADTAITMTWDSGELSPNESKTFTYYTSLDGRDFDDVQGEIVVSDIEKDIEDIDDMDDVKKVKDKIDNEKDLKEEKKKEFKGIIVDDLVNTKGEDITLRDDKDIKIVKELIEESDKTDEVKDDFRGDLVKKAIKDIIDLKEEDKDAIEDVINDIGDEGKKESAITATGYMKIPTYTVSGTVNDNEDKPASGADVKIMKGSRQIGTKDVVTDVYGEFTISDVANGTYNLVVEKIGIIVTKEVAVNSEDYNFSGAIKLPGGKTNSIVHVKSETPDIVVGNLDKQFEDEATDNNKGVTSQDKEVLAGGGSVEIKLTAEKKDDKAENASDINASAKANGKTVGIYIDLSVEKTVIDVSGEEVTTQSAKLIELPSLIDVYIPLDKEFQGKSDYVVYRYHGSQVDIITNDANDDGEKIKLVDDKKTIQLTVKKFSTYAIAFKTEESDPILPPTPPSSNDDNDDNDNNWKSSIIKEVATKISVEDRDGGKIHISKDKKDISIIPDKGYVIGDLIIDGKNVGPSEKYTFTDKKDHKITPVFVKETTLPYYMKDNKKIYIGFSNILNNIYKSIIPEGVIIEFEENPKNFKDNTIEWAKSSIEFVTQREIFLGTSEDIFSPKESMTRAMFVTAIGRLYESSYGDIKATNTFSDVDEDAYYAKYIGWANKNKIIKGIGENKFAPNDEITREQMSVIMMNFAKLFGKADAKNSQLKYADSINVSSWALDGAKYCQETGIITGRNGGYFAPQESATRGEVAVVIQRFIKEIVNNSK